MHQFLLLADSPFSLPRATASIADDLKQALQTLCLNAFFTPSGHPSDFSGMGSEAGLMSAAPSRGKLSNFSLWCARRAPGSHAQCRTQLTSSPCCLPASLLLKSSLQWLTFRGERTAYSGEEDGWERLISGGVAGAHHDGSMETGRAERWLRGCAQTPSCIKMQVASCRGGVCRSSSGGVARLIEEEVAGAP